MTEPTDHEVEMRSSGDSPDKITGRGFEALVSVLEDSDGKIVSLALHNTEDAVPVLPLRWYAALYK